MNANKLPSSSRRAILLDGTPANDRTGPRVSATVMKELQSRGWEVEHVVLREQKIGNCAGDFFCWIRSPGMCIVDDDNRAISAAVINSDLTVFLTPVTCGGYSSELKCMVDHLIQNISPFFTKVEGETHHTRRYERYPDFLAVGWQEKPDAQAETLFRHLVHRNAINFYSQHNVCGFVLADQADTGITAAVHGWLNDLDDGHSIQDATLPKIDGPAYRAREVHRALLLVGSPRTRKSTSNSLGAYLYGQLGASIETETIYLHTILRSPAKLQAMLEAVDAADLVTLSFPIYVDALPAPVVEALSHIAAHRKDRTGSQPQSFIAIANCGFPEAQHTATALAICELFAQRTGFQWAGALGLGGGEMIRGADLAKMGGPAIRVKKALELAAAALVQGQAIPEAARTLMAKPAIPAWLYRLAGWYGWKQQAKRYNAGKLLKQQPYMPRAARRRDLAATVRS
ncbi:MAG: NAD(P)H-dependent oxidoreductase [Caldilineaceae bacterium]|nr:NAD(P)H-dependent oxidoreductase [Caldilineaceae bacterium]